MLSSGPYPSTFYRGYLCMIYELYYIMLCYISYIIIQYINQHRRIKCSTPRINADFSLSYQANKPTNVCEEETTEGWQPVSAMGKYNEICLEIESERTCTICRVHPSTWSLGINWSYTAQE